MKRMTASTRAQIALGIVAVVFSTLACSIHWEREGFVASTGDYPNQMSTSEANWLIEDTEPGLCDVYNQYVDNGKEVTKELAVSCHLMSWRR